MTIAYVNQFRPTFPIIAFFICDHGMVRAKLHIDLEAERRNMFRTRRRIIDTLKLAKNNTEYQAEITI